VAILDARSREFRRAPQRLEHLSGESIRQIHLTLDAVGESQPEHVLPHVTQRGESRKSVPNLIDVSHTVDSSSAEPTLGDRAESSRAREALRAE
jgi:hypothetical protein